ncbi:Dyp-type peroxidase [Paraburkholderia sediminicola]|uniref:Dyp-type peroxidase n=1 Tax=Paraburkholderia sediminicola TaxID=458836 RepID=UPI0038BC4E0D
MVAVAEPILDGAEIQGDILAGFRKDHVRLIFICVTDEALPAFKRWIRAMAGSLAYLDAVLGFNVQFSAARKHLHVDPAMSATWMNLAITGKGAKRLLNSEQWAQLDSTFLNGPLKDATLVGEPVTGDPEGPQTWLVGAPNHEPDAVLIIAGDRSAEVDRQEAHQLSALRGLSVSADAVVLHVEVGVVREAQPGHEHFGFKDSVSQPGVRGRLSSQDGPFVTTRVLDSKDPLYATYAAPGQPLCWPGEFVLGYPRKRDGSLDSNDTIVDLTTPLTKNGSYLVYRRLRQDVPAFVAAANGMAAQISTLTPAQPCSEEFASVLLVGRWPNGAPLMRSPHSGNQALGDDTYASNNFFFAQPSHAPIYSEASGLPPDKFPEASGDAFGITCPYTAHIRKVNPRDQNTDQGSAVRTLEHRILRRGIPYGVDFDPSKADSDAQDRGLHFLCYQSSIARGFQFLMNQWANSGDFPLGRGHDIVIGQNGTALRQITLLLANGSQVTVNFPQRFVITTGAAYLFSASRTALVQYFGS